ncbi:hypothetical protein RsY01_1349 [Lactococcus reticulitermitis]|uniref:Uncharacterized protein n=1 Tax=Pseudolactococcus reticulitermitis TaxID=2025039 RepID=A0A224X0I8_9LACT|nr:hypothetical protein RsY01_1349 [Lactococcus reticulitermitis]
MGVLKIVGSLILIGLGAWGTVLEAKWLKEQADKNK